MSKPQILDPGTIINNYQVINLIGAGGYAGIYKVENLQDSKFLAMKTETYESNTKTLPKEIAIMKQLQGPTFPKLKDEGKSDTYHINFLIMSIFGPSIDTIQLYHKKHLDIKAVYNICFQMLTVIESFHQNGFVHRDIKPSNFLIQNNKNYPLVLIDFGISQRHIDPKTNKPIQFKKDKYFNGTSRYASIAACKGCAYGRKDDLISWFYSFIDLACGSLPWDEASDFSEMIFMKKFFNITSLNRKFPKEISILYKYIKNLKYAKEPDYDYIKQLFVQAMKNERISTSFNWDLFYLNHSNLEVFQRELGFGQLKRSFKQNSEKVVKNDSKFKILKKTKSAPIDVQNNGDDQKQNSRGRLIDIFKLKKKSSNGLINVFGIRKKSSQNDSQENKKEPDVCQSKNHECLHDNEKNIAKKRPPVIPHK